MITLRHRCQTGLFDRGNAGCVADGRCHLLRRGQSRSVSLEGCVDRSRRFVCYSERDDGGQSPSENDLTRLEISEPELERGAEQAAATVVASTVFGGIVWAVLGASKGEGACPV
jgi:hypothetical protein